MRRNLLTETENVTYQLFKIILPIYLCLKNIAYYYLLYRYVCMLMPLIILIVVTTLEGVCDFKFVIEKRRKTLVYTRFYFLLYTTGTTTRIF